MTSIFVTLGPWNWIVAGLLLLIVEVAAPGAFMMWLGIAALLVGAVSLMIDWSWQAQFVTFALLAVASIPLWRKFGRSVGQNSDQPFLNRRAAGFIGRSYILEQPIVEGAGRLRINDTLWKVRGPDTPAGGHIQVVAVEGATLIVVADAEPLGPSAIAPG